MPPLGVVVQAIAAGAATGAVYGLVGLGYALVYRMSGVLNFAQGDLVSTGAFTFLLVLGGGAAVAVVGLSPWLLALAVVVALVAGALGAVLVERLAVTPFISSRGAGWIAATAAAGLLLRAGVGIAFPAESYAVPEVLPLRLVTTHASFALPGGGVIQVRSLAILTVALGLAVVFDLWLARSRTGRAMQAVSQDTLAARVCGLDPARLRLLAWSLAGGLAVIAGLLVAPSRPLTVELGLVLGLKGTAAAVLGGLRGGRSTVIVGLGIGVAESLLTTVSIPALGLGPFPGLQDVGALLLLVAFLAMAPGVLGRAEEAAA